MKKEAASLKTKKNLFKAKTRQPQTKGNKIGREAASLKTKKIIQSQNPTALTQRQKNGKRSCKSKNKKSPRKPKPDSLKPRTIKRKKKLQV